jgi:hypothetical protein
MGLTIPSRKTVTVEKPDKNILPDTKIRRPKLWKKKHDLWLAASCVFNLQALLANPNSQPPRGGPGAMHNGLCSRREWDGGRVTGALKLEPLAREVNPKRKA